MTIGYDKSKESLYNKLDAKKVDKILENNKKKLQDNGIMVIAFPINCTTD